MKKIKNPFLAESAPGYLCYGCSPNNDAGLKMEFTDEGEFISGQFKPESFHAGYAGVLHGGIQATLLDEIASWLIYTKCQTAGVTADIYVKYLKPVLIANGEIKVTAKLVSREKRLATVSCQLTDGAGTLCATAEVRYFIFSEEVARNKYHYPGITAFYD